MTTTLYITCRMPTLPSLIARYLSKYFQTEIVAIEEKTTAYLMEIFIVQFTQPLPQNKLDIIWEQGEYRFWPEPARMFRIYISNPNIIPSQDFISQRRYVVATGDEYYRELNHPNTTCYIMDKKTYRNTPITENPFVFN